MVAEPRLKGPDGEPNEYREYFGTDVCDCPAPDRKPRLRIEFVDPMQLACFDQSEAGLEELALFTVLADSKKDCRVTWLLNSFLTTAHEMAGFASLRPFAAVRDMGGVDALSGLLKGHGFASHRRKAEAIHGLARTGLDLRACSVQDLEAVPGVERQAARLFLLHSREGQRLASLDAVVLHHLRMKGYPVPIAAPVDEELYLALEQVLLRFADKEGMTPAQLDQSVWAYAQQAEDAKAKAGKQGVSWLSDRKGWTMLGR